LIYLERNGTLKISSTLESYSQFIQFRFGEAVSYNWISALLFERNSKIVFYMSIVYYLEQDFFVKEVSLRKGYIIKE